MAGFTTVQSLGSSEDKSLRDAIDRNDIPGPRLLSSLGQITGKTGNPKQLREYVENGCLQA